MKLIEAMKQIKELMRKAEDIRGKVKIHCAHLSFETPTYGTNQGEQVREWLQAHGDIVRKILELRVAVQRTNLATRVKIEMPNGVVVEKTIAEWIHRRRELASLDMQAWASLSDRNLKEGPMKNSQGEIIDVKIIRNFEPKQRDTYIELFRSEPMVIDSALETVNATTDLV